METKDILMAAFDEAGLFAPAKDDAKSILMSAFDEAGLFAQDEWTEEDEAKLTESERDSLAEHDKARHKGHFDSKTMTCKFREKIKEGAKIEELKDEVDDNVVEGPDVTGFHEILHEKQTESLNPIGKRPATEKSDDSRLAKIEDSYTEAVKHGNLDKAQELVLQYAQAVSGDSFLKDITGLPQIFYHGAQSRINVFDPQKDKNGFGDIYFTDMPEYAQRFGDQIHPCLILSHNPSVHDWMSEGFSQALTSRYSGHDAAIVHNVKDFTGIRHGEVLVRDNKNIKSAAPIEYDDDGNIIPLARRFDMSSADIRGNTSGRV